MGQYFSNEQLQSNIQQNRTKIRGHDFTFFTDHGVFSKEKLDYGSRILLETIPIPEIYGEVLDVGCGYGPIGITVSRLTNCHMEMCDVNKRAVHLTNLNIKENKISHTIAYESDCYSNVDSEKKYDFILTNPPIRAGKRVVYEIVMGAKNHLKSTGKLFLVIRKEQGAKSMINDLQKIYNVIILEKSKGFFIIQCSYD